MFNIILKQLSKITQYLTRSRKKPRTNPKTIDNLYKMKSSLGEKNESPLVGTKTMKVKVEEVKEPSQNKEAGQYTGEKCIRHPYKLRKYIKARRRRTELGQ